MTKMTNGAPAGDGRRLASARATPEAASPARTGAEAGGPGGREPPERRSLRLALLLLAAGAVAAMVGAGRAWATVHATTEVPQLGVDWTTTAGVTGNDVAPLSALALLAVLFALGIAVTRGRGRWPVGAGLTAFGLALGATAIGGVIRLRETALHLAITGRLEKLPAGASLRVDISPVGPSLVVAGGLLIVAAGVLTVRHGRRWPVLGERYKLPADRPRPTAGGAHGAGASDGP